MNTNNKELNAQGVSLWLDYITREILDNGTLKQYINELSVTGLTSNPTIFDKAISSSNDYDEAIRKADKNLSNEDLFLNMAIEDIQRAADLLHPVYERTNGVDGFVSIEVSPLLAYDTENTLKAAKDIFQKVNRSNVLVKIPGTPEGLPAIENAIAEGIPINVTLLFSAEQYEAAAYAYMRGVEHRLKNGLNPDVRSVASVFVSRWDKAIAGKVSEQLLNKLGLAVSQKVYESYIKILQSNRMQRLMNAGVSPQRLLWGSTGAKDPATSDLIYVENLIAPFTVNTMPEKTLLAFADHGNIKSPLPHESNKTDNMLDQFKKEGVDIKALAEQLQKEGADAFSESWNHLMGDIEKKRKSIYA